VPLEAGCYDRIVLANALPLEPVDRARSLVAPATRALKASGRARSAARRS
jgi:hypothetical protein